MVNTENFRDYLYYAKEFTVFSDNKPFALSNEYRKVTCMGMRWRAELEDYNFKVKYHPEKISRDCHFSPRYPIEGVLKIHSKVISLENISLLVSRESAKNNWLSVSTVKSNVLEKHFHLPLDYKIKNIYPNLLIIEQENDPTISSIVNFLKTENKTTFAHKRKLGKKARFY